MERYTPVWFTLGRESFRGTLWEVRDGLFFIRYSVGDAERTIGLRREEFSMAPPAVPAPAVAPAAPAAETPAAEVPPPGPSGEPEAPPAAPGGASGAEGGG
jgi:hypothetical protein